MRHEVETGHKEDQVQEQGPVALDSDLAFFDESLADVLPRSLCGAADVFVLLVHVCLGKHETPDDEEDRRAGSKPEKGSPFVRGRVDESPSKGGG